MFNPSLPVLKIAISGGTELGFKVRKPWITRVSSPLQEMLLKIVNVSYSELNDMRFKNCAKD